MGKITPPPIVRSNSGEAVVNINELTGLDRAILKDTKTHPCLFIPAGEPLHVLLNIKPTIKEELVLSQVILMDKETGRQYNANLQTDIKPWPTEPEDVENHLPIVFNKTFTFKFTKKEKQAFKMMVRRNRKLPRKLKKALKHFEYKENHSEDIETQNTIGMFANCVIAPKQGYPHTKWVLRAAHLLRKRVTASVMNQASF